jgi:phi13 family phage major tail protein
MALKRNEEKVKFGLKRVAFAIATIAEDGTATYGDVITFPGARTLSMEPQGAGEPWNADDGVYYSNTAPTSRQGDLEMARIIDAFKRQVLGYIADANGILVEDMSPSEVHFALLFETMNDRKPRRYVMYNCTATAPTVGSATNEGSKEPQTETTTITSMGIYVPSHDKWFDHGETTPATDPEAYANWFSAVQVPGAPADPYPVKRATGDPVIIDDGADMAVVAISASILPAQSGSGEPSPDNVRTISARSACTLTVRGDSEGEGADYTVDWESEAGPIYGGTLNLTTGELTVDRAMLVLSDLTWAWHAATQSYTVNRGTAQPVLKSGPIVCEKLPYVPRPSLPTAAMGISISDSGTSLFAKDGVNTGDEGTSAFMAGIQDVKAVLYLTEPLTYQLDPVEVRTLLGDNTIQATTGPVTVSYHSDPSFDV